jgi:CubicO group peptidase (beta-lactamase class C family)
MSSRIVEVQNSPSPAPEGESMHAPPRLSVPRSRLRAIFIGVCFAVALTSTAEGKTVEQHFSSTRLARIQPYLQAKVNRGELAGAVVLVARNGKIIELNTVGYSDAAQKTVMKPNSIFRIYSMTKPIASTALMMLYDEGKFQLDDPISKYIPAFKGIRVLRTPQSAVDDTVAAAREPTIRDLFRHTAGFIHGGPRASSPLSAAYADAGIESLNVPLSVEVDRLAKIPLAHQPDTSFQYSIAPDVIARLVEILSGMPFDQFLGKRLFEPLGMYDTAFSVPAGKAARLAKVHWTKNGALVPADDEHGFPDTADPITDRTAIVGYLSDNPHKVGSYGLVSTAHDYWRFAQMLLNGGELDGHRYLRPSTVRLMHQNQLKSPWTDELGKPVRLGWGLGFCIVLDPAASGTLLPKNTYYWGGAAGTLFWLDPANGIVVVAMTQHLQAPTAVDWTRLQGELSALVYGAMVTRSGQEPLLDPKMSSRQ